MLETQRAVQCDSEIDRVSVVVKLQAIPCHIEFAFGICVPYQHMCACRLRLYVFGPYASSRLKVRQEPTLVYVQHVENHSVGW